MCYTLAKRLAMLRICFQPGEGHEAHCTPRNDIVLIGRAEPGHSCGNYPNRVEAGGMHPCDRRCRRRPRRRRSMLPAGRSGIIDPSYVVWGGTSASEVAPLLQFLVMSWSFQDVQSQRRSLWRWLSHPGLHLRRGPRFRTLPRAVRAESGREAFYRRSGPSSSRLKGATGPEGICRPMVSNGTR